MHSYSCSKHTTVVAFITLILGIILMSAGTKASGQNKTGNVAVTSSKPLQHLAVIYFPFSPYTVVAITSADLERYLHDAIRNNAFRPNGPVMFDTIVASKQQIDSIVELFDTKVTPAKYPSGEAEILIEDQFTGKKIFIDQFGVVKTDTQQYRLKAATFERLHNLMRQIMPPLIPSRVKQQK